MLGQAPNETDEIHLLQCGRGMFNQYPWVLLRLPGVFPFYSSCKPLTPCYIVRAPGNAPTAKDPMGFISSKNKSAITAGSGGGYLNPSKIQSGGSVRFALLEDQPLEFFECWGESSEGGVKLFVSATIPVPRTLKRKWVRSSAVASTAKVPLPKRSSSPSLFPSTTTSPAASKLCSSLRRVCRTNWTTSPKWRLRQLAGVGLRYGQRGQRFRNPLQPAPSAA